MKRENRFLNTVSDAIHIETKSLPGVPLIEICDQKRVLIENHQGIVGYGSREILIKVRYGVVCVCGDNLKLIKVCKEKLIITGKICTVNLRGIV